MPLVEAIKRTGHTLRNCSFVWSKPYAYRRISRCASFRITLAVAALTSVMTPVSLISRLTWVVRQLRFSVPPILECGVRSAAGLASFGKANLKTSWWMRYYSLLRNAKNMERTPEPELMDEQEQAAAYAGADWSESHEKIPRYFRERF